VSVHQLQGDFYYDCGVDRLEDTAVGSYVGELASDDLVLSHPEGEY